LDRELPETCECILYLPKTYTEDGFPTPLILAAHGSGGRVSAELQKIGGLKYASFCMDAGYAVLDVNGSALHGRTIGCPEHIFALYKAYRYATRHFNLSKSVLVWGGSMGGQTAMNFANTFPSITLAVGLFYPRLNMDGITVGDHYCPGSWDKTEPLSEAGNPRQRVAKYFRFPSDEWCEKNTLGFNPHKTRSFTNQNGECVLLPPCPIKIWHGTEDKTIDPMISREYVNSVRRSGSYIELHLLEGVGHKANAAMKQELKLWFDPFI
jgi:pimeloyl-ACP methyl ester carboxylesterase